MATDILQALNEIEAQLASLTIPGDPPVPPSETLNAIAVNIETMRATLEQRSVAETTAQNTNFADLTLALSALRLVCCTNTQITLENYFTQTIPLAAEGGDVITPEYPFVPLPDEYTPDTIQSRKCWAASQIVGELRAFLELHNNLLLDELTNILFAVLLAQYIASLATLAIAAPIFTKVFATVGGALATLAGYVKDNLGLLEFSTIVIALDNRKDDLICDLIASTTTTAARNSFGDILQEEGIDLVNRLYVGAILNDNVLGYLFYDDGETSQGLYEAAILEGFAGCQPCDSDCGLRLSLGSIVSDVGGVLICDSAPGDTSHYVQIHFDAHPNFTQCGAFFTISNVSVPIGQVTNQPPASWRMCDFNTYSGFIGNIYHSNQMPDGAKNGVSHFVIKSGQSFRVQLSYVQE